MSARAPDPDVEDTLDLSVIVVSWNTRELLLDCVANVERELALEAEHESAPLRAELIVVDNGSTDGSVDAIRNGHPRARLICLPENRGYARGNNAGLAEARGRNILMLNSDAMLERGAVRSCVDVLDADVGIGAAGLQLVHPDGRLQSSIHAFPSLGHELLPMWLLELVAPRRYPSKRVRRDAPVDVDAVLGAAFFVRRDVLDRVGGLPEDYFFFLEETDWCWQMRRAGLRVVHIPDARAVHHSGASSKQKYPLKTRIEYNRSLHRFLRKNRGFASASAVRCVRVVKNVAILPVLLVLAIGSRRYRERLRIVWGVVIWHALGCPASWGLEGRSSGVSETHGAESRVERQS